MVRAVNIGGEVNHIPAFGSYKNTSLSLSHYKGPSIFMDKLDHQLTASWGSKKSAFQWRTMQEHLIQRGKFGKAMEMDIRDIQRKFGDKYNDAMRDMIEYANNEGLITNSEAKRLKNKYLH